MSPGPPRVTVLSEWTREPPVAHERAGERCWCAGGCVDDNHVLFRALCVVPSVGSPPLREAKRQKTTAQHEGHGGGGKNETEQQSGGAGGGGGGGSGRMSLPLDTSEAVAFLNYSSSSSAVSSSSNNHHHHHHHHNAVTDVAAGTDGIRGASASSQSAF